MKKNKISIIGLGYVGLPLAIEFAKIDEVVGFDLNNHRIRELKDYKDLNLQISQKQFKRSKKLLFTNDEKNLENSDYFIITVPTPINKLNKPDLKSLISATKIVGKYIKKNGIVIYESTVFPGCTEEICAPLLSKISGLKYNKDFFCGYSPERINVGDKKNTLKNLKKVTSGSNNQISKKIDSLYKKIITAGTHRAPSIKVAEAAKVIENTQRDLNIGLVNELSIIFNKMKIDTADVLKAAATKWNFVSYKPGLVGGHCIGVDPYYLTYKAKQLGYKAKIILTGRKLNNSMSVFVSKRIFYLMQKKRIKIKNSRILIFGMTFKKNCTDIRNTKVFDLINKLVLKKIKVDVYDPWVNTTELKKNRNYKLLNKLPNKKYDASILAVSHNIFSKFKKKGFTKYLKNNSVVFDIENFLDKKFSDERL
jgi:UDP-N-acetyl-D-glucosamine/UDP-N-acetyl-D-galactosamine dehydrogenase